MTPENMLKEGRLDEALQGLTAQVRGNPADAKAQVFLFQLLAVLGQWERAQNQLMVSGEPAQWLALLLQSLKLQAEDRHAQAQPLREQAFEQAEAVGGEIDGTPFEWIADADPRFGPCLEMIVNGGYAWVPFTRLK